MGAVGGDISRVPSTVQGPWHDFVTRRVIKGGYPKSRRQDISADYLAEKRLSPTRGWPLTGRRDFLACWRDLVIYAAPAAIRSPRRSRRCRCRLWPFPRLQVVEFIRSIRGLLTRARSGRS